MSSKTSLFSKYLFALFFAIAIMAPVSFLYAASPGYVQLAPLTGLNPPSSVVTQTGLAGYLQTLFWLAIVLAGVLAVLMITKGGILYMASEAFNTKAEAKKQITMAIVGFLLAISSVLILTTINPDLLKFNLLVRRLVFEVPHLQSGSVEGCTNLVNKPTTACLWYDTDVYARCDDAFAASLGALEKNNYRNGTDSDCVETKPSGDAKCCQFSAPEGGCSGAGRWAGKTQCRWSPKATSGNDCTDDLASSELIKTNISDEIFCYGQPFQKGAGWYKSDCCVK